MAQPDRHEPPFRFGISPQDLLRLTKGSKPPSESTPAQVAMSAGIGSVRGPSLSGTPSAHAVEPDSSTSLTPPPRTLLSPKP